MYHPLKAYLIKQTRIYLFFFIPGELIIIFFKWCQRLLGVYSLVWHLYSIANTSHLENINVTVKKFIFNILNPV